MTDDSSRGAARQILRRCASQPCDSSMINDCMVAARAHFAAQPWRVAHILAKSKMPSPDNSRIAYTDKADTLIELSSALIEAGIAQVNTPASAYLPENLTRDEQKEYYATIEFKSTNLFLKHEIANTQLALNEMYEEMMADAPKKGASLLLSVKNDGVQNTEHFVSRLPVPMKRRVSWKYDEVSYDSVC